MCAARQYLLNQPHFCASAIKNHYANYTLPNMRYYTADSQIQHSTESTSMPVSYLKKSKYQITQFVWYNIRVI